MKISEIYEKKKRSLSFEIFPPKKESELGNIDETLAVLCELKPDFISVTFGAGGSANCNRTIELAKKIKYEYHVEPVVHLTCLHYNKAEIDEFAKILEYRANASGRINHAHMFLLLAHVRQFMHKQRPRYYSNLFKRISTELGISQRAVSIAAKNLETAGILHCEELPRYKTNNQWHTNVHIFVDLKGSNDYDWHIEMEAGINQIRRTSKREN